MHLCTETQSISAESVSVVQRNTSLVRYITIQVTYEDRYVDSLYVEMHAHHDDLVSHTNAERKNKNMPPVT